MQSDLKLFVVSPRLRKVCMIFGVIALIVFAVSLYVALTSKQSMLGWGYTLFHFINSAPDSLRTLALCITFLGSVWMLLGVGLIATLTKKYLLAWWLALSTLLAYGGSGILKYVVDRPRPMGLTHDVIVRSVEDSAGYPSGHTALAAIIALTLCFYLPKSLRYWIVALWITVVAASRLYLGVHSPIDVIGGASLALLVFCLLRVLPLRWRQYLRLAANDAKSSAATDQPEETAEKDIKKPSNNAKKRTSKMQ